jgi:hypothetical protein
MRGCWKSRHMSEIGHLSRSLRCNKQRPQRRDLAGVLYARRRFGGQEDLKAPSVGQLKPGRFRKLCRLVQPHTGTKRIEFHN